MKATGVVIATLGSPASPSKRDVAAYLREFLMDPLVIDVRFPLRWLLVKGIIVPLRAGTSSGYYRKVWTDRGAPLLHHTGALTEALSRRLGSRFVVRMGTRYGSPPLREAIASLAPRVGQLLVCPQYPQYAASTYESTVREARRAASALGHGFPVRFLPPFYNEEGFIASWVGRLEESARGRRPDHYVFSFHGLPVRHVRKGSPEGGHCLVTSGCCERSGAADSGCYPAQCHATAWRIAERAGLGRADYTVAFQSRMRGGAWIAPHTDEVLVKLAGRGARQVAVLCPSFTADCLETLEEVGIRLRGFFQRHGGTLDLIPCLNAQPQWVEALAGMIVRAAGVPQPLRRRNRTRS